MTLHINTITRNHILSVSDRLLSTNRENIRVDYDEYKHLVLITDDARVVVTFTGFAGNSITRTKLVDKTIDFLTDTLRETSRKNQHELWQHLRDITYNADAHIRNLRIRGNKEEELGLAIFTIGWFKNVPFGCIIDNCLEPYWKWSDKSRPAFKHRRKNYGAENFKYGFYRLLLGRERDAIRKRALCRVLDDRSRNEDVNGILDTSVEIIRAVSSEKPRAVGRDCSAIRISKNDSGIQCFDYRDEKSAVFPNVIYSTSRISVSVTNFRDVTGED